MVGPGHAADAPAKELPEGFCLGDLVYYCGDGCELLNGTAVQFGAQGKIVAAGADIQRVVVEFYNQGRGTVLATWLATEDPVLPGGYRIGDRAFWCGGKQRFQSGNMLAFGLSGRITGRGPTDKRVRVLFDGNDSAMDIGLVQLSRKPPTIPGGYLVGAEVHYCGEVEDFANGDRLEFGLKGEIVGRATLGDASDEKRVKVSFEGHQSGVSVFLTQIMRDVPVIPGGFSIGDVVKYVGKTNQKFNNGDKLGPGMKGTVACRSSVGDGKDDKRLKVRFYGNKMAVNIFVTEAEACADDGGAEEEDNAEVN
eukprot:TRINITY_DN37467_c0_g1_i1.p1 TRINITY_DN37467_c0_g1~~TRINITY_DN37467_c0_g1_i1.p1  ORF type:complete len:309 (-),score=60.18 TRINITY_DN37467_c0_g1_i1:52-978(-)